MIMAFAARALWLSVSVFIVVTNASTQSPERPRPHAPSQQQLPGVSPSNAATIKGRVLWWSDPATGIPNVRIHVTNQTKSDEAPIDTVTAEDGTYAVRLKEGTYVMMMIWAFEKAGPPPCAAARFEVTNKVDYQDPTGRLPGQSSVIIPLVFGAKDKDGNDVLTAFLPDRTMKGGDSSVVDFRLSCR